MIGLVKVLWHDVGDRIPLSRLFNFTADPGRLRPSEEAFHLRLPVTERPIVKIGCVVQMSGVSFGIDLNIEQPLRYDPPAPQFG